MSSNLLLIGKSGTVAARAALDLTAQNIANAANADYARRTLSMAEVAAKGGIGMEPGASLSGVRPDQVLRTNSLFLQNEARRTSGDLARADAELAGLGNAETAIEQAGIYPALVDFEASLARLASDPLGGALRAAVVEDARRLAQTFQIASNGLGRCRSRPALHCRGRGGTGQCAGRRNCPHQRRDRPRASRIEQYGGAARPARCAAARPFGAHRG